MKKILKGKASKKTKKVMGMDAEDMADMKKGTYSPKEEKAENKEKKVITVRSQPKPISNIMSRMMKIKGK